MEFRPFHEGRLPVRLAGVQTAGPQIRLGVGEVPGGAAHTAFMAR
jgi:hypothetical protein